MDSWEVCLTEAPWTWQHDGNAVCVLAHLLGLAATESRRYGYETLACGDTMTSHTALSEATGLTVKQVRLALAKLEDTCEIESIRRPRGLLIRVLRYPDWQTAHINKITNDQNRVERDMAGSRQTMVTVKASKGQDKVEVKASKRQSHNIDKEGFLNNNTPLSPPTEVCTNKLVAAGEQNWATAGM